MREEVLVVRRESLFGAQQPQGYIPVQKGFSYLRACRRHSFFAPRHKVENDPTLKQIIPYCVLCWEGRILVVVRKKTQSEARLHGLASVGVGGHITPADGDPADFDRLLLAGFLRELSEEVHVRTPWRATLCGFLNDDSNSVGSVHFGFVYRVECAAAPVVAETEKMRGGLVDASTLTPPEGTRWESWSQILVEAAPLWLNAPPAMSAEPFLITRP
ncbi:MAG: hypothetical protein DRP82_00425 [Planctomycetota bacterium]|nr:MAG: hypothetical protein DRP82_00425 [Planctomycetota bacterium]